MQFLAGADLIVGGTRLAGRALGIAGGRIAAVAPDSADLPGRTALPPGSVLAPGFVDVQVNGGGGYQFNAEPTASAAAAIAVAHRALGTAAVLPTLITDTPEVMGAAAAALAEACRDAATGVAGAHFEGPYLNPERAGVHRRDLIRAPDAAARAWLAALPDSIGAPVIVTLAPERFSDVELAALSDAGLILCAGHSAADATIRPALRGYTHVFNAMPPLAARAPGIAAAALLHADAYAGVIADGVHVAPAMLRLLLRCKGPDRVMLVSDAMAPAGTALDSFLLQGRTILRRGGRLTTEDGTLAGADLCLAQAVRFLVREMGVPVADAVTMASETPAAFLGLADRGRLAVGARADLVLLLPEPWMGAPPSCPPDARMICLSL